MPNNEVNEVIRGNDYISLSLSTETSEEEISIG
jgi:hypothetical protein